MSRRMWVLAVAAWVGVVIVGSGLTWLAIDRAGRQVTSSSAAAGATEPAVVGTVGDPPVVSSGPTRSPSAQPTTSSAPSPTGTPTPTQGRPTPSGGSTAKTSSPATTEVRTWSGEPGSVTVSCSGRTVRFGGASPNDGWHVERGDDSGDDVEVKFEKDETEVKVRATCVGGVPRFSVETGGDDD